LIKQTGLKWSEAQTIALLKRVFEIEIEHCPHCGGVMRIIVAILEASAITEILDHHGFDYQPSFRYIQPKTLSWVMFSVRCCFFLARRNET
jgi:hypothetical protein